MKAFNSLLLGLVILLGSGCEKERYHKNVTLERDGEVYSISPDELDDSIKNEFGFDIILEELQQEHTYGDYRTDIVVDNHMYSFLIVIPVKTKDNLQNVFSHSDHYAKFTGGGGTLSYQTYRDMDDYFHYKIYAASNRWAAYYILNDIQDQMVEIRYTESNFDKDIKITSNKLTIPAEEFEHMLERLAIPHDRLEFQP